MKYIVSFSGGKDSTAMLLRLVEEKKPIDDIVFCDTGKEFPDLIKQIDTVENYINMPITRISADKRFDEYFLYQKRAKTSKYADISGYGWPSARKRWCTTHLKTQVFKNYIREKYGKDEYTTYIGLAYDENYRVKRNTVNRWLEADERKQLSLFGVAQ